MRHQAHKGRPRKITRAAQCMERRMLIQPGKPSSADGPYLLDNAAEAPESQANGTYRSGGTDRELQQGNLNALDSLQRCTPSTIYLSAQLPYAWRLPEAYTSHREDGVHRTGFAPNTLNRCCVTTPNTHYTQHLPPTPHPPHYAYTPETA